MWPWGHLAVGYLCYVAVIQVRDDGEQTFATLAAVVVGSQLPDLVDKPLAWTFSILPSGRSLAHSLLVAVIVIAGTYWFAKQREREEAAIAFGVAYVSHSLADLGPNAIKGLAHGNWSQLEWTTYLLWPVFAPPPYPSDDSFVQHLIDLALTPYMAFQLVLFAFAVVVWVGSGAPGFVAVRRDIQSRVRRQKPASESD
jgi:hypothetical protein